MATTRILIESTLGLDGQRFSTFWLDTPGADLPPADNRVLDVGPLRPAIDAFETTPLDPTQQTDIVRAAGEALWQSLCAHDNAQAALAPMLVPGAGDRQVRVDIHKLAVEAKTLPWEVLHKGGAGFLGPDLRVPILREVRAGGTPPSGLLPRDAPLPVLVIIAARDNDGRGEWAALRAAFAAQVAGAPPAPQVLVLTVPALKAHIEAEGEAHVTVELVPPDLMALVARISAFGPRVAHLFCHGHAASGGLLEVDHAGTAFGADPVWLSTVDLATALEASTWVAVLNACSGAAVDPLAQGTVSLCERLVEEGLPIVVGMRAPINAAMVHRFAGAFMAQVLASVSQIHAAGSGTLDLAAGFSTASRALLAAHGLPPPMAAQRTRDWSLPVMMVGHRALRIDVVDTALSELEQERLLGELQALTEALANPVLIPTPALRQQVQGRIDEIRHLLGLA